MPSSARSRPAASTSRRAPASAPVAAPEPLLAGWLRRFAPDAAYELSTNGGAPVALDRRTTVVMLVSSLLLTGYFYYGQRFFYVQHIAPIVSTAWPAAADWESLLSFWYRALSSAFWRLLLPLLCIVLVLRDSPRDYGFRLPEPGHGRPYLILYLAMVPVLAAASFLPGFQATYPLYDRAGDGVLHFLSYQIPYGIRFAAVEAFFRGFLLFALFRRLGYHAVLIMMIPYCMIHFGKPIGESLGAIVAGLLLGFLALRSRSWIPGALLHWAIATTMDLFSLLQQRLP